jgi:hypothetical protein
VVGTTLSLCESESLALYLAHRHQFANVVYCRKPVSARLLGEMRAR